MKVPVANPLRRFSPRQMPLVVVALGVLVAGLAGCRNDGSQQDAYIRDLRMHEQQIYELQDYMTEYQELLRQQRKENAHLRDQLAQRAAPSGEDALDDDATERSLLDPPQRQSPEPLEFEPDDLPQIDPGEPLPTSTLPEVPERPSPETSAPEALPDGQSSARTRGGLRTVAATHDHLHDPEGLQSALFVPPPPPEQPADTVAIYAEQMSLEPAPGDQPQEVGLMAIVEPMTSRGTAGRFDGELSLMIVDPIAEEEGDWQIARWDYTIEEVEQAWRDPSRRVLDLPVAAPATTPLGRPLELWVRLVPTSGEEKILSRTMIELAPPTRLVGVPVSGRHTDDSGELVSSGWQAAEQMHLPKSAETRSAGSWKPSEAAPLERPARSQQSQSSAAEVRSAAQPQPPTSSWAPQR